MKSKKQTKPTKQIAKREDQKFLKRAERFRKTTDPTEAMSLGDKLGRIIFSD